MLIHSHKDVSCEGCLDCQPMLYVTKAKPVPYFKCYGLHPKGFEMKQEICKGDKLPEVAPDWCPKRKR